MERKKGREKEREREKERDSFGILYTGYLLFIVKIKKEKERKIQSGTREKEIVLGYYTRLPISHSKD